MKQKVLRAAWNNERALIKIDGARIFFDHDYPLKIQHARRQYAPLRKELHDKRVKTHIIYPASECSVTAGNRCLIHLDIGRLLQPSVLKASSAGHTQYAAGGPATEHPHREEIDGCATSASTAGPW